MLKELKKFAKENPIHVTVSEKDLKSYAYAYDGNTIAYYELSKDIDVYNDLIIPSDKVYDDIGKVLHSEGILFDDTPFDFVVDKESSITLVSANNFTKSVHDFTKYYAVDDYRTELSGLHVRSGTLFASDSIIMRLKHTNSFPKNSNMIIDINPIVEYLGVNVRKVKPVGKSLFATKKSKNDDLEMSVVTKKGEESLKLKSNKLTFIITSMGKSSLSFDLIKKIKTTHIITLHRESLISKITNLLSNQPKNSDSIKNMVRFRLEGKLSMSNYKDEETTETMNCKCETQPLFKDKIQFVLNAYKLLVLLKSVTDSEIQLHYEDSNNGGITRVVSSTNKDLLLIAQTLYK